MKDTPFWCALTSAGAALLVTSIAVAVLAHFDVTPIPYLFAVYIGAVFSWEHRRVTREAYWEGEYGRVSADRGEMINTAIVWQERALKAERELSQRVAS